MDFAQTQKSTCATVQPKADKSNYVSISKDTRIQDQSRGEAVTFGFLLHRSVILHVYMLNLVAIVDAKPLLPRSKEWLIHSRP